jgi:hypothetical protein
VAFPPADMLNRAGSNLAVYTCKSGHIMNVPKEVNLAVLA